MLEEQITINIKSQKEPEEAIITNGYILLYLKGDRVKSSSNIELKSLAPLLAPLLVKLAMEKLSK